MSQCKSKWVLVIFFIPAIACFPWSSHAEETTTASGKPTSFWMEKKLEYSQDILRDLALGNLDEVASTARRIRTLSKVEGWLRNQRPGYSSHLRSFEFANQEIMRHAEAGNVEGATISFHQMTTSCVGCHQMLRKGEK